MTRFVYDGSFDGFLCAIPSAWEAGDGAQILAPTEAAQGGLFGEAVEIDSDERLAERVRSALETRMGADTLRRFYRAFLSEQPDIEATLLALTRAVVERGKSVLTDFRFAPAFRLERLGQQVGREVHRMHAFVRFEEQADGRYVATVHPDFNVLPLLGEHFVARYPAMDWAIADVRRRYALVHEAGSRGTRYAPFSEADIEQAEAEERFQRMWQTYFHAVNIPERANPRLHLQHVPRRYWPYLTEKQV